MAAPLALAPMRYSPTVAWDCLTTVSVVQMASAKRSPPVSLRPATNASTDDRIVAAGKSPPMTPVEHASTESAGRSSRVATAAVVARASRSPRSPRPAFASPLFTRTAEAGMICKRSRVSLTGAAGKTLVVSSAADPAGRSTSSKARSGRPLGLRPAVMPLARKPRGKVTLMGTPRSRTDPRLHRTPPSG